MSNQAVQKRNELKELLDTRYKGRIESILRERAPQFAAALVQVVNRSWSLQKCKPESVIGAAITAAALDLSIEPALGEAHLVPYGESCTFQIGYRGITQLALRSGQYKRMGNCPVKKDQLKKWNRLTGELEIDFDAKTDGTVIGYAAWFQLVNGFERGNFWTEAECLEYAARFSASFKGSKKNESPWVTHKEKMCLKTVWIDLVRPWGPKSVQMQTALAQDNTVRKNPDADPENVIDLEPIDPHPENGAGNLDAASDVPGNRNSPPAAETAVPSQQFTPAQHLEHFVVKDCGFNFERFRDFADSTGLIADADSLGSFNDIKAEVATRILRVKMALKEGLSKI